MFIKKTPVDGKRFPYQHTKPVSSLHEVSIDRKIVKCSPHLVRAVSAPPRPVFDGRQRLQLTDIVIHREVVLKRKIVYKIIIML